MSDVALEQIEPGVFDIALDGYDLKSDEGLKTAVIISLFTDRRANDDDEIPDGTKNRRGWWGDSLTDVDGDLIGSRLWLLSRSKETEDILVRAREYALEALQWLLDDGIASAIGVIAEHVDSALLGLQIDITPVDDLPVQYNIPITLE